MVGGKLGALRRSMGVGQDEAARAIGYSRQTISALENGAIDPPPGLLIAYTVFLWSKSRMLTSQILGVRGLDDLVYFLRVR